MAYFEFARPQELWRIIDEAARPVALYTSDDVVTAAFNTFGDDAKTVVLHHGAAADTTEQTLLDAPLKLDDCNTRRRLTVAKSENLRRII